VCDGRDDSNSAGLHAQSEHRPVPNASKPWLFEVAARSPPYQSTESIDCPLSSIINERSGMVLNRRALLYQWYPDADRRQPSGCNQWNCTGIARWFGGFPIQSGGACLEQRIACTESRYNHACTADAS
jgi:hypothetical protein